MNALELCSKGREESWALIRRHVVKGGGRGSLRARVHAHACMYVPLKE